VERAVLASLESGCQVPIGVWCRMESGAWRIDACVLSPDGSEAIRESRAGSAQDATAFGRAVGAALLERGAARLLRMAERTVERR
jgi:hydroxymethylbilane synthase